MPSTRRELEQRLQALESRMPELTADMNAFFPRFEDVGGAILADAVPEDEAYVEMELLGIVQRAGITPKDIGP